MRNIFAEITNETFMIVIICLLPVSEHFVPDIIVGKVHQKYRTKYQTTQFWRF